MEEKDLDDLIRRFHSENLYTPPVARYKVVDLEYYKKIYMESVRDPCSFWGREAEKLAWSRKWRKTCEGEGLNTRWFVDGEINVYYNLIEKHRDKWVWSKPAVIWESEDGSVRISFYKDLYERSSVIARALEDYGVRRGEWVIMYVTPSIESLEIFLALMRIGAPVEFIFTGFGYYEIRKRIMGRRARHIISVDGFTRRGRSIDLLSNILRSVEKLEIKNIFLVRRIEKAYKDDRIVYYEDLIRGSKHEKDPAILNSRDPLIGLHTGYVEDFKPLTHGVGGFLVQVYATSKWIGLRPHDTYFCTVWPGWITGISYQFFGPLMIGSTIVFYEGGPDQPSWNRWWDIIERYSVTLFLTTGSALRMLRRNTPEPLKIYRFDTLKAILVTAEPLETEVWEWSYRYVGTGSRAFITSVPEKFSGRIPVVNLYIQSEIGSFATGSLINYVFTELSPGSVGPPIPGFHIDVVDKNGNPIRGSPGMMIIRSPWPSMPIEYPEDFSLRWARGYYETGDLAIMSENMNIYPLGRYDGVMKISGYRISPGAIERVLREIANLKSFRIKRLYDDLRFESYVVEVYEELGEKDLRRIIRESIGAIAEPRDVIVKKSHDDSSSKADATAI
ncbi:MAG: AMP-binding protein [Sulfolobales archaeon]